MYRFWSLLFLLFTACSNPEQKAPSGLFFDLKSFIDKQITVLSQQKPVVDKQVGLNNEKQKQTTRDIDWSRELELFLQADINKAAYQASYQTVRPDSLTYEYRLKPGEKLPVRYLRIEVDSVSGQPRLVQATLTTKNYLYESVRNLELQAQAGKLQTYYIEGFQQLIWLDRKPFMVSGKVMDNE